MRDECLQAACNLVMLLLTKTNWVALTGLAVAAAGIILYTQLGRIVDLRVPWVLDSAALGSIAAAPLGSLMAVVGSVMWARRASTNYVVWAAILLSAAIVLVVSLVNVKIHSPSAILIFVAPFGVLDAMLLFLIAGARWRK